MEGLRGVAVTLVFGVHFATLAQPWIGTAWEKGLLGVMHTVGHAGVDLFFVLSGFLIYGHLLRRKQRFGAYLWRRVQRIYPVFLAVFALYLFLSWQMPGRSKLPSDGSLWLYLLANLALLPGLFPIEPLITVAWSLSYEMFFYLAMPLAMAAVHLRDRSREVRTLGLAMSLIAAFVAFGVVGGPVRLTMFLFGALLAEILPMTKGLGSAVGALAGLAGLAVMVVPVSGPHGLSWKYASLGVCIFVLCHAALSVRAPLLSAALCFWPLRWLGNMSYSYYLLHGLALHVFFLAVGDRLLSTHGFPGAVVILLVPAFIWTLIPAAALFLAVERPLSLATKPRRTSTATARVSS